MAQSAEERRAAAALRMREKRARERAEREAATANAANGSDGEAGTVMRDAVEASLKAMSKWIVASDAAAVAQARMLARQIDSLEHAGDTVRALSAHGRLTAVLDRLGGTPVVRLQHELRSRKLAEPEVPTDGSRTEDGPTPGNVSRFERPPKRGRRAG